MRKIQKTLGHEADFDYAKPQFGSSPTIVTDYRVISRILRDQTLYSTAWTMTLRALEINKHILVGNSPGARQVSPVQLNCPRSPSG
jgi:hypothetical protein